MKKLMLCLTALVLLTACGPSDRGNTEEPAAQETGTPEEALPVMTRAAAADFLAGVTAEDLGQWADETITAEDLAALLRGAAEQIEDRAPSGYPFWQRSVYLSPDQEGEWSSRNSLALSAGTEDALVEITLRRYGWEGSAAVVCSSRALYQWVSTANDVEEYVDPDLLALAGEAIQARMDGRLEQTRTNNAAAGYTGAELVLLKPLGSYTDEEGRTGRLSHCIYGLLPAQADKVNWAGGMALDSKGRVLHMDQGQYLVTVEQDGALRACNFWSWDIFWGLEDTQLDYDGTARYVLERYLEEGELPVK